ncbi:MAG: ATP-binding cassette domain-containing protein [Gammaproteobacteria bacterium]|nr:ATP-binding cassette domain-containing protein [Gammaproteobacteria bacterium]
MIQAGECFGLLGPNGAGKTTTLRMFLGLTLPESGSLTILGHPIPAVAREARARIGVVPQLDNLDPDFTVAENLRTYASYFGLRGAAVETRITQLLVFANLQHKTDAPIDTLSGGMKRRLTLARALINDPQILILDEPTTGLDPQARQMIWQRLRELKQQGKTLILTTHYMEEAQRLCDRLAIIDHGRIITQGSPDALIQQHIEPYVVEVYGNGVQAASLADGSLPRSARIEQVGETVFIYMSQEDPNVMAMCQRENLRFLHRRATLEDVFLKLTGRDLRE